MLTSEALRNVAIYGAVPTRINESLADIAPSCPGGNCTFDPYWSLAVCTRIGNVSDNITVKHLANATTGYPHVRYYITPNRYLDDIGYTMP